MQSSTSWFTRSRLFAAISMLAAAIIGLWMVPQPTTTGFDIQRVILISIDTCRPDRFGCYGNSLGITPHIDNLAKDSFLFENAMSPVPMTLPAHCSLMTGLDPVRHGVHDNFAYKLGQTNETLAELLHKHQFMGAAIISSFVLDSKFGMDQGFTFYEDKLPIKPTAFGNLNERRGDDATKLALDWLAKNRNEQTFFFLHYYDAHAPYEAPEPFASQWSNDPYSGEIAFVDSCLGRLFNWLKKENLYDTSLIILTGDHGEMLGEHKERTHSYFIYQSAIHVPLLFKLPGNHNPRRINEVVGLVDVLPTVCGLLKIESPEVNGRDLCQFMLHSSSATSDDTPVYCESITPLNYEANALRGLISGQWKYIHANRPELYDLSNDRAESRNLASEQPEIVAEMSGRLLEIFESSKSLNAAADSITLDGLSRRNLETLGYVGTTLTENPSYFDNQLADPKDRIEFHENVKHLAVLVARRQYTEAKNICMRLLEDWPEFYNGHLTLAKISLEQRDLPLAEKHLRSAITLAPDDAEVLTMSGKLSSLQNRPAEAVSFFQRALSINPESTGALNGLGIILVAQGKNEEGATHFRRAIEIDPQSPEAHQNLASVLFKLRRIDEAIGQYRIVLNLAPDMLETHRGLGVALQSTGRLDEAYECFRRALALNPQDAVIHHNLASILASRNQLEEAIEHYRAAINLQPDYPQAHNNLGAALTLTGKNAEALTHYREAVRLQPDWLNPLNSAAWIMATHPNAEVRYPSKAVQYAKRAASISRHSNASILDTLAAAYASAGLMEKAVNTAKKALALAQAAGDKTQTKEIKSRLSLYLKGQPYIESR